MVAGLGVTRAAQTAFDRLGDVASDRRPSFLRRQVRGLGERSVGGQSKCSAARASCFAFQAPPDYAFGLHDAGVAQ